MWMVFFKKKISNPIKVSTENDTIALMEAVSFLFFSLKNKKI
jgi:hypothetical protein